MFIALVGLVWMQSVPATVASDRLARSAEDPGETAQGGSCRLDAVVDAERVDARSALQRTLVGTFRLPHRR